MIARWCGTENGRENSMKTIERTAVYTGGGVYLFYGRFEDDRCFFFDNAVPEEPSVMILDTIPNIEDEEQMQWEWQMNHMTDSIEGAEAIEVIMPIFREILQYGCTDDSNYNDDDIMDEIEIYGKEYLNLLRKSA